MMTTEGSALTLSRSEDRRTDMSGTDRTTRLPPPRRFENYILTRVVDSSVGLTNVSNTRFTQAPDGAGDGARDDAMSGGIPIGFDFQIDGIVYKNFAVNTNGWMVLIDPTVTTFNISDVLISAQWVNTGIKPTFTNQHVLLAPWFDDLRNCAGKPSDLNNISGYSVDKLKRIASGIETPPNFYNPSSYGVSYYVDARSHKGRRLIVRWASISNYAAPSSVIRFEVVLYENGTIEYRYSPRTTIQRPATNQQFEGATCGIFMPNGTNRFRDFSVGLGYREGNRRENIYGGYDYDPNYTDLPALGSEDVSYYNVAVPYTVNLLPWRNWPGLNTSGCVIAFSPPVNRRKILPRKMIRNLDSELRLPLVARTGDSRLGRGIPTYDDRIAPTYTGISSLSPAGTTFGAALDGLQWLLPRISDLTSQVYSTVATSTQTAVLAGEPGSVYNVSLRIRGVVEQQSYSGGTSSGSFQIGGAPGGSNWNVYRLSVSNPAQDYYLNRGTSGIFSVFAIDYTVNIPIAAGATVTLYAESRDNAEIANNINTGGPISIPGITDPPQPYAGQFVQMTYVGASVSSSINPMLTGTVLNPPLVNYPTTLPRFFGGSGVGTFERQNLFSGDFMVTGSVVKSAVEQYVNERPIKSVEAFNESSRPEQDFSTLTSSFFDVGTSPEFIANGFDQNLKSKTQIRFSLPVSFPTAMPPSASTIYYYNSKVQNWQVPNHSNYSIGDGSSLPPAIIPGVNAGGDIANSLTDSLNERITEDARGFGPIGNLIASGAHKPNTTADQTDPSIGSSYDVSAFAAIVGKTFGKSIRNNEEYRPTPDETFTIPINAPFIIEKAVFEIPVAVGPGWFADRTQVWRPVPNISNQTGFDFAGPAMTVALYRSVQLHAKSDTPSVRDLILTGTITHALDNTKNVVISNTSYDSSYQVRPVGFKAYADPAGGVINPDVNNNFTGSVMVQAVALNAVGMVVKYQVELNSTAAENKKLTKNLLLTQPVIDLSTVGSQSVKVISVSPMGRGGLGFESSGRSTLGNEHVSYQGASDATGRKVPNPFLISSLDGQQSAVLNGAGAFAGSINAAIPLISHFPSPYLVMPGDKLVLSISKMRPFIFTRSNVGYPQFSGSLSHDVTLMTGAINVTLYGSLLQEGVEYHDTLNQPLGSDAVHEMIGAEPIIDQFEVAYRNEYSGSFTDNVMMGSMLPVTSSNLSGSNTQSLSARRRMISTLSASLATTIVADNRIDQLNLNHFFFTPFGSGLKPVPLPPIKKFTSIPATLSTNVTDTIINGSKNFRLQPWVERAGDVRVSQFTDQTERYWDSMMPAISDCFAADGSSIFITKPGTFGDFRQVNTTVTPASSGVFADVFNANNGQAGWIILDNHNPAIIPTLGPILNCNWNKSFPFEPRYAKVSRQLTIEKSFIANYIYQPGSAPVLLGIPPTPVNGFFFGTLSLSTTVTNYSGIYIEFFGVPFITYNNNTPTYEWLADSNVGGKINLPSNVSTGPYPTGWWYTTAPYAGYPSQMPSQIYATGSTNLTDAAKGLFGFGDRNTYFKYPDANGSLLGTGHFPDCRDVEGPHPDYYFSTYDNSNFRFSPVIRGWKYGVHSGLPAFSKAYWRRGRFGQFRDMLEQRPFTKYFQSSETTQNAPNFQQGVQPAAVTVTFLNPATGRLTAPDATWSSNLHFECTSSLPFFDGQFTGRTEPVLSQLNKALTNIRQDGRGNIQIGSSIKSVNRRNTRIFRG